MPIYNVDNVLAFPSPDLAENDGLLAIGGDLSLQRLQLAYNMGIFPWFNEGGPLLWWSPDPRMVLFPDELHIAKSMRPLLRSKRFHLTADHAFTQVVQSCQKAPRPGQDGTWITENMVEAYVDLHRAGWAHSVEVWEGDQLVGGLYGVVVGQVFCGESMFAKIPNTSKLAFIRLTQMLHKRNFTLIDCQIYTEHLARLGAREIPRHAFQAHLPSEPFDFSARESWYGWDWS